VAETSPAHASQVLLLGAELSLYLGYRKWKGKDDKRVAKIREGPSAKCVETIQAHDTSAIRTILATPEAVSLSIKKPASCEAGAQGWQITLQNLFFQLQL
jgi:hypothetical protein